MKNLVRFMVIVLIMSLTLLTACGTQPASTPRLIPDDLQAIEAAAEDIIDFAPSGNWDKISADVTEIAAAWKSYQSQAGADGASQELQDAMTSALTELQAASEQNDAAATMQASNDVSTAVVEMFALYNPKVPADIGRLDVLERQVILDVAREDYPAANASLARAKSAWERVKDSALEHNGKDAAAQFEASLAAQASALATEDNEALIAEARNALELVDSLERLY